LKTPRKKFLGKPLGLLNVSPVNPRLVEDIVEVQADEQKLSK
jgi:hypothetical protein